MNAEEIVKELHNINVSIQGLGVIIAIMFGVHILSHK